MISDVKARRLNRSPRLFFAVRLASFRLLAGTEEGDRDGAEGCVGAERAADHGDGERMMMPFPKRAAVVDAAFEKRVVGAKEGKHHGHGKVDAAGEMMKLSTTFGCNRNF